MHVRLDTAAKLPQADLDVHISVQTDGVRQVRLLASSAAGSQVLAAVTP